ncbi:O-acetyl-ADP-ribose deacetylase [Gleimia hominis]|uniref:O-acetyl-ADP-ribose deacetylase n=1 Tax=Gleimia hominis TaxID=595468 RepID=A0ABU3IA79_9ACTO|nr:O-acetyl-ADP-ribose deacetylase [Gleimia hominis]MDT3767280.1 O-acetyl-ADP-ribose deacetylase [Gleimia hominis]
MSTLQISTQLADITTLTVDAIVNAANSSLLGGGGVDGAIHRAAGPKLLEACKQLRATSLPDGLPVGQAVATSGFNLPARWVIHTVGPNKRAGQTDPQLLRNAFTNSLNVATELGARTVAFPAISGGVYGWDMPEVAHHAIAAMRAWKPEERYTTAEETPVTEEPQEITFALFSEDAKRIFDQELSR